MTAEADPRHPAPLAPGFVGRDRELALLEEALTRPQAVVLIEGEAGIGKSRLVREVFASSKDTTLVAACPPFRQPQTLGPIADALRQVTCDVGHLALSALAGALRPLFPEWASGLPPAPEPAEDATAARYRIFAALGELLSCLKITVVVVEDLHWADDATMEFLLLLAARQPERPRIVVTFRPEDVPAYSLLPRLSRLAAGHAGLRLSLRPLDAAGTASMVSSMLPGERMEEELAAFVYRHTEGLPLGVEEMVRLIADRAYLDKVPNAGWLRRPLTEISVPSSISDAVVERVGRLSPDAQAIVRAAAVLAERAEVGQLAALAQISASATRDGLAEAIGCALLDADQLSRVSFRHVLACLAVYEAIPGPARQLLHLRAGRLLESESPPPVSRLARHFREAGDNSKWHRYAEQAVDLAQAASDDTAAARLLRELLTDPDLPVGEVPRLARKIPIESDSVYAQAGLLRTILATRPMSRAQQAEVRYHLGRLLCSMDEAEGHSEIARAVPHLAHSPVDAAHAMLLLATPRGDWPGPVHRRWLRRAAKVAPPADPADRLRLLVNTMCAQLSLGENDGWTQAALLPSDTDDPREWRELVRGQLNVADQAVRWGRYADAARQLAVARAQAERHEYRRVRERILVTRAHLDWLTGSWQGLAERAAALAESTDGPVRHTAIQIAGLLDTATGAQDIAAQRLRQALDMFWQLGFPEACSEPAAALARLHMMAGHLSEALDVTAAPADITARKQAWIWGTDLVPARVEALIAADRDAEAAELTAVFGRGLHGRDAPAPKAGLLLCRAVLSEARGDPSRAAAMFGRAAAAWQRLPRPYHALLARERQASCLLTAGGRDAGLVMLRRTMAAMSRLGAVADAGRVARTLREHGVVVRRPGAGRPGYGNELSPRELAVIRLLVGGKTNQQIAEALFVTPRTVAFHLDSARRKLGVPSRAALAAVAVERGIVSASKR